MTGEGWRCPRCHVLYVSPIPVTAAYCNARSHSLASVAMHRDPCRVPTPHEEMLAT